MRDIKHRFITFPGRILSGRRTGRIFGSGNDETGVAAEQEVLEVVRRVCKEHNLKFYACGGTLLEAVRHKGFIPWDDDIDIYMLRDEYDRFLEVAPKSLSEGYVGRRIDGHELPVELPFETITMPVTKYYIDALLDSFGPDYMTPVMFDGDHEYPFYQKQEAAMKIIPTQNPTAGLL